MQSGGLASLPTAMLDMKTAAIQISSGIDVERNIAACETFFVQARTQGVELLVFPENVLYRGKDEGFRASASAIPGPVTERLCALSRTHAMAAVWGGIVENVSGRYHNSCVFISASGEILSVYRKMHLFELYDGDTALYHESELFTPGSEIVITRHGGFTFGSSICYDLRFPELYRAMVEQGADVMLVPSDFTRRTGQAHWLPLLQARAIENLSYVVAPNESGVNAETGATSHGNSCIISPWGEVLAACDGEGQGMCVADLTQEAIRAARQRIRALAHRRQFHL